MKVKRNTTIYLLVLCTAMIVTLTFACIRDYHNDATIRCYQGINEIQAKEITNRDATIDTMKELVQQLESKCRRLVDETTRCEDAMDIARARIENLNKTNRTLSSHINRMGEINQTLEAKVIQLKEMLGQCNSTQPIEPAPSIPGCR
jgi:predicted RNase H-like nuclease (RuvC/YqgF family)